MIEIYQFDRTSLENKLIELYADFVPPKHAKPFAAREAGKIRFGDTASVEDGFKHFVHVATVDADDLDEAFELTNLWNDEDRVEKKAPMHSASVGDVFRAPDGIYYMVDNVGFTPVWAQRDILIEHGWG
tara:strand:- start:221 stop:607 length:387 start_codon:yes stop_codon:yes gene_type:complete